MTTRATHIVLQTKNPRFPRAVFLVRDEATVSKLLDNAFVFKGVEWDKIPALLESKRHPEIFRLMQNSDYTWSEFFQHEFPYTLVPFQVFPSPTGYATKNTDLERMKTVSLTPAGHGSVVPRWEGAAGAILLDKIETMTVKMRGRLFPSPCQTCENFFAHLAGQCHVLQDPSTSRGRRSQLGILCHMKLFLGSDAIEENGEETPSGALPVNID